MSQLPITFDIISLYPEMLKVALETSILGRAQEKGIFSIFLHQLRNFSQDKHHSVDNTPYGGGAGMVLRFDVLHHAWQAAMARAPEKKTRTIFFSPQGKLLSQAMLEEKVASDIERWILVCGRFEGVDERFLETCVDEEISLGNFVLSGGEIPAMAFVDGFARLIPGVLGNSDSIKSESFSAGASRVLEYPQYTFPREFLGREVPEILLSGNHAKIAAWRAEKSKEATKKKRPELSELSAELFR